MWVIRWDSKKKNTLSACIILDESQLAVGCKAGLFAKRQISSNSKHLKEDLSFSILSPDRSLDLVAQVPLNFAHFHCFSSTEVGF